MNNCPKCGGRMAATNSRRVGSLIERYRACKCGYVDRALVRPAEVLKVMEVMRKRTQSTTSGTQVG